MIAQIERRASSRVVLELDGIRGIAVLLVLLFHFGARPAAVPRFLTAPFALGWSGVDLFFVLSGFLITGILLDTKDASNYFSSFYARRVLRILPLYLTALILYFLFALPLAHAFGAWRSENASLQLWYWGHISNWQSAFGNQIGVFSHFWSLSIEEQFYLVWPLVVLLIPRQKLAYGCGFVIAASLGLRFAFRDNLASYPLLLATLTPFRLDTLAFGALGAVAVRDPDWSSWLARRIHIIAGAAAAAFAVILLVARTTVTSNPLVATIGFTLLAIAFVCMVFGAYVNAGSEGWLWTSLRSRMLMSFGRYSYAMYVFHFPLSIYQNRAVMALSHTVSTEAAVGLWASNKIVGVALSYVIALASWHLLERRFLQLKSRFTAVAAMPAAERLELA